MVGAAEPEARRRCAVSQSLARQDRDPGRRADRRRAALLLFRRRSAQHRRSARLRALHRAGRPCDGASGRHPRRALDLCDPQRRGCHAGAEMAGAEDAEDARPRRRRHHGRELPALPHAHLSLRGNRLHLAAAGYPRSLCREMVGKTRHPGTPARQHRGGGAPLPTSPSAAPRAPTSSAASRG